MTVQERMVLSQLEVKEYLKEIENLETQLRIIREEKANSYRDSLGDRDTGNAAFEEAKRKEAILNKNLNEKTNRLANAIIIERKPTEGIVGIGSIVTTEINFGSDEEIENITFKLVSGASSGLSLDKATINGPLGKAIYGKSEGSKFEYLVGDRKMSGVILKATYNPETEKQLEDSKVKTLTK